MNLFFFFFESKSIYYQHSLLIGSIGVKSGHKLIVSYVTEALLPSGYTFFGSQNATQN